MKKENLPRATDISNEIDELEKLIEKLESTDVNRKLSINDYSNIYGWREVHVAALGGKERDEKLKILSEKYLQDVINLAKDSVEALYLELETL